MNNGNKLALEVKLLGDSTLEIVFLFWDKRFLSDYSKPNFDNFVYFESNDKDFCMYSQDEGYIIDGGQFALIVPDAKHMKTNATIKHKFKSDDIRFKFLKTMYEHLVEWAQEWETFKNDEKPNFDLIIHQQFWVY